MPDEDLLAGRTQKGLLGGIDPILVHHESRPWAAVVACQVTKTENFPQLKMVERTIMKSSAMHW